MSMSIRVCTVADRLASDPDAPEVVEFVCSDEDVALYQTSQGPPG